MNCSKIQSQTSLNIDLFRKKYSVRLLKTCDSYIESLQTFFEKFKTS